MKKDDSELFEKMHIAGKLAARTLDELTPFVKPGVTTNFLDKIASRYSPLQSFSDANLISFTISFVSISPLI